jgi:hypothetical protein
MDLPEYFIKSVHGQPAHLDELDNNLLGDLHGKLIFLLHCALLLRKPPLWKKAFKVQRGLIKKNP